MRLLCLSLLLLAACPEAPPKKPPTEYEMERVREWRFECEHGRGPNPECPEKPT